MLVMKISLPTTHVFFFIPHNSIFSHEQKLWDAFSEVFLVQIGEKFEKYFPKFSLKAKKLEDVFQSFNSRAKMETRGVKKRHGSGKRNFVSYLAPPSPT
jgi:hypothetical protein